MKAVPHLARAAAAVILGCALAVATPALAPARTVGEDGQPITNQAGVTFGVVSHRGGALEWPENSLEAFTNSVAAGFDSIETDIVFTRDGHGVMSHNDLLSSRCTRAGRSIHLMTLAEVAAVRCKDRSGKLTVPIPTFEQLAELLKTDPTVGLSLDIKSHSGQSAAGRRDWAARAMRLVRDHGLLAQTSIISFYWKDALPVIRKYAPEMYVLALDSVRTDLGRVRLASKLGADGYGTRMKYTSAYLASYVKAKGMDSAPWAVTDPEWQQFTIATGGKLQLFSTDAPTATRAALTSGRINLNPVADPTTTKLRSAVTVSSGTYLANRRHYPVVLGKAVPATQVVMLRDVTLAVTVRGGNGTGNLYVGASSSPLASSTKVGLPKGTRTLTLTAPVGNGGKLRIYTSRSVKLTVKVVAYTRLRFA